MPSRLGRGTVRSVETLPASWYHDPAVYERERTELFGREWLMIGRSAQFQVPGDYLATDMCGWHLLVVAGQDGEVRAFHNVCRHRAGPLVDAGTGHCGALVCRYHGWSYELDGRLKRARDFGEPDIPVDELGLVPVSVGEWRGLVFVNLDLDAVPVADALGPFAAECEPFAIEDLHFSHQAVHEVAANWKTYADNYMEGYHIPLVHPRLNKEVDARRYRVEVGDRYCSHWAPARDGSVTSGKWLWRFPNLAINLYPGGMNVERFLPLGPRHTRIVYDYFFRDVSPAAQAENDEVVRLSLEVLDEDRLICEAVQRNLESGVYTTGRLSPKHENGVGYLQALIREAVGG
jgi:choline monooxygenase